MKQVIDRTFFFLLKRGLEGGMGREGGGRGKGELPLSSVGSRAGGDNRKRAHNAQRRVGPKA